MFHCLCDLHVLLFRRVAKMTKSLILCSMCTLGQNKRATLTHRPYYFSIFEFYFTITALVFYCSNNLLFLQQFGQYQIYFFPTKYESYILWRKKIHLLLRGLEMALIAFRERLLCNSH